MDNAVDVCEALLFGFPVSTFLLNSTHVLKAVDLSKECLILVNQKAVEKWNWIGYSWPLKLKNRYITNCFKGTVW